MTISLCADHAGYKYKELIKIYLTEKGIEVIDHGCFSEESVDYPDFVRPAALDVSLGRAVKGIGVCGSGIGVAVVANKVKGIRAAQVLNILMAKLSIEHNDSNFLSLASRLTDEKEIIPIVEAWLNSKFQDGRHSRRVEKIEG
ncbi:MAG: RpiB/LacA/LacB family sugar-phosphate isomerase [Ignavibacteriales bacterium]|nr:RpiB/LacA/LacB family sugar-phosphate isomerase [Ignavibacteriales bacterium]